MARNINAEFDGLRGNAIFCSWTGTNPMSPQRAECLLSIYAQTCCPVLLLSANTIPKWELEAFPFHEAYQYLSATQKADYLRTYMMHHFGGGHTDLKRTHRSWTDLFQTMREAPHYFGMGYTEIGPHGVAPVGEPLETEMRANYTKVIGNCAYIFRRKTEFTYEWMAQTHRLLDDTLDLLKGNPAQHPQDHQHVVLPDGTVSAYPLPWMAFCNIFHRLVYRFHDQFLHADIAPQFVGYR